MKWGRALVKGMAGGCDALLVTSRAQLSTTTAGCVLSAADKWVCSEGAALYDVLPDKTNTACSSTAAGFEVSE